MPVRVPCWRHFCRSNLNWGKFPNLKWHQLFNFENNYIRNKMSECDFYIIFWLAGSTEDSCMYFCYLAIIWCVSVELNPIFVFCRILYEFSDCAAAAGHQCLLFPGDYLQFVSLPAWCVWTKTPSAEDYPQIRICTYSYRSVEVKQLFLYYYWRRVWLYFLILHNHFESETAKCCGHV